MEDTTKTKEKTSNSTEEFLFFTGATLLITYFILASPITPNFRYNTTIFWTATTILTLTIAPDYLNKQTTKQWITKHKNTKTQSLYEKIYNITQATSRHLNPTNLLYITLLLALTATATALLTGNITEACLGISYGLLIKAILSPTTKNQKK